VFVLNKKYYRPITFRWLYIYFHYMHMNVFTTPSQPLLHKHTLYTAFIVHTKCLQGLKLYLTIFRATGINVVSQSYNTTLAVGTGTWFCHASTRARNIVKVMTSWCNIRTNLVLKHKHKFDGSYDSL